MAVCYRIKFIVKIVKMSIVHNRKKEVMISWATVLEVEWTGLKKWNVI